jgi:hypothetical protein
LIFAYPEGKVCDITEPQQTIPKSLGKSVATTMRIAVLTQELQERSNRRLVLSTPPAVWAS